MHYITTLVMFKYVTIYNTAFCLEDFVNTSVIFLLDFRKDFLEIDQSETRIAYGGHVC
jgi:hypothetical protein